MKFQKGQPKPKNAHKFPRGHKFGIGNAFRNRTIYNKCVICGKETKSFKSRPRKTCSKKCQYELVSRGLKGNKRAFKKGIPYDVDRKSPQYKEWRMKIYLRDNFTCQICGEVGGELNAHHIRFFAKYPKLRFNVDNGITLCVSCHKEVHKRKICIKTS